jgi:hypothetical protein
MNRDMKKIIENTVVNNRYSLNAMELAELSLEKPTQAILDAFTYGYALGRKEEQNARKA